MIADLPGYVSIAFILTTFVSIGFLLQCIKAAGLNSLPAKILLFLIPMWLFFQAIVSQAGFYQPSDSFPPRLFLFGPLPALATVLFYLAVFRADFVNRMPLRLLTAVQAVRIPVEIVLYWLFLGGLIPAMMTFKGWNFDIAAGILAIPVAIFAFRNGIANRKLLIAYNILGLALLVNVVTIAVLSLESPIQLLNFDQPNRAVLFFPYIWLPTIVVPIALFAHLASLSQLLSRGQRSFPNST